MRYISAGGKIAIEINPSRRRADEADPISASPLPHPVTGRIPRTLTVEEIRGLEWDFGRSVTRAREAGFDAVMIHLDRLRRERISAYMGVKEERITEEGLEIVDSSGKRILLEADQVILSAGSIPNSSASRSFAGTAAEFHETGDCREACKILEAIHGGYRVARNL